MPSHASTLNLTVTCVRIMELTCKILALENFHNYLFASSSSIEICEILHHEKISRYTVLIFLLDD